MSVAPSILEELVPASNRLYFIFGGIAAEIGMPPFEFYNASRILTENKIFLRDFSQSWYQNGLPGLGRDVYEIAERLAEKIRQVNPVDVYFVGNSMGGYAAILFAALVGSGTAIAFAPQTFISPISKLQHLDLRWPKQIATTCFTTLAKRHVWDLKALLSANQSTLKIEIHVSTKDRLDLMHARRLHGVSGTTIHEYDVGGHALVRYLRDEGRLSGILQGHRQPGLDVTRISATSLASVCRG
ncbi:MAG: hypothetical protein WKF77_00365 [Planctomycetaceae bacterium]